MTPKRCRTVFAAVFTTVLVLALGACGYPEKFQLTEQSALSLGWLAPRAQAAEPIYCYRSLAKPVCHSWPQKDQERRLVGFYGPSPF